MCPLLADTSFDNTGHHAWSANTGWIAMRHDRPSAPDGVVFGESHLSGLAYSANTGWMNLGDGSPTNGHSYSNASYDHGVNHDGQGNLTGYAWGANTGWIHFGWASATDTNRPQVDLHTGKFSGYAWSANTGWIQLGGGLLQVQSMACPDTDVDGIADHWEFEHFGDLATVDAASDWDDDGHLDAAEYTANTDPRDALSYLTVIGSAWDGGLTEATLQFTTTTSRLYRIEYSTDLGQTDPWTDSPLGTFSADPGGITTRNFSFSSTSEKRCFFRIVAVRPLTP